MNFRKRDDSGMERDCRTTALKYIGYREQSTLEVSSHLKEKGFSGREIEETIEYLKELNYINDERFCMAYASDGRSKGRGPMRIKQALLEKGISGELVDIALTELLDPQREKEAALREADKILRNRGEGNEGEIDEKILARIGRRLSGLGYHTSIIYEIIGQLRKN